MTLVGPLDDLWSGEMMPVVVAGRRLLLVNVEGSVHAYEDRCLHKGIPLSAGRLTGAVLTCSAHEWQYDVRTGQGINPCGIALRRFPVELRDGQIWVEASG